MIIGVSLKAYFGYAQTLTWCRQVASSITARQPAETEIFILPSFPMLADAGDLLVGSAVSVGAQDLAAADDGAQTGEVTGALLAELGCRYVEVGHAERRTRFGEDEVVVAAKTAAALRNGLVPVLCLGEADRLSSDAAARECVRQLHSALSDTRASDLSGRLILAYEPHWAIGAPEPAPDEHILTVCQALRGAVRDLSAHRDSAVIYGGSAGPGLLGRLAHGVDGLFLGRFAHDVAALTQVLDEAEEIMTEDTRKGAR